MSCRVVIFILVWVSALGCNRSQKKPSGATDNGEATPKCFLYVEGRDSIKLSLVTASGEVHGRLAYLFFEKDKSMGTLDGLLRGDTLFATYRFTAEGTFSIRELAFLRKGDTYLMGTGEILNEGNRDVFKDPHSISFDSGVALKKISCDVMGDAIIR